jgi:hypothetical protein
MHFILATKLSYHVKFTENLAREIHTNLAKRTREEKSRVRERIENACTNCIT